MSGALKTDLLDHISLVYVIGSDVDGPVKIGISSALADRARGINTSSPYRVKVFGVRFAASRPDKGNLGVKDMFRRGAQKLEKDVHRKLKEFDLQLNGEWFDIGATDALAAIDKVGEITGNRAVSLTDLLAADLTGRADISMASMHRRLMHEAVVINQFIREFNEGLTFYGRQAIHNATANSVLS